MHDADIAVRPTTRRGAVLTWLLLGGVALLLRVLDLGSFVTLDEINFWMPRSEMFLEALQAGAFADTAIRPHPGVTTMWLGSAGILLRRSLPLEEIPFPLLLALMRLPVALVHVAGLLLGYALLRRMLPASIALLAALFWATDPFMVAYSRVLHLDALAMTFATVSMLSACCYWHHERRRAMLVVSAVCGALAFLSKVPGLIVLPVVGGVALWAALEQRPADQTGERGSLGSWRAALSSLLLWGGVFALTIVLVWPAVWADPLRVAWLLTESVTEEGALPHMWGNFFLGERNDTPGPTFYPVALALRSTPWALLGLLLLPWGWQQARSLPRARRDLLVLVGLVLLFILIMSLSPKKFNRYLVPISAASNIVAAAGLVWGIERLTSHMQRGAQRVRALALGGVAAAALVNAAWWHPYGLAAFNQALGGAPAGAYAFAIGWGEGLGQAAEWLNQQPDITGVAIASTMNNSLRPYLRHGAHSLEPPGATLPPEIGYVLVYVRDAQRGLVGPPFDQFYPHAPPLHTVTIHGVDYAWIYQVPPPVAEPLAIQFGEQIELRGYGLDPGELRSAGRLLLTTQWQAQGQPAQDYLLFAHLLNAEGERVGQLDAPPAGPQVPTSAWRAPRVYTWEHPLPVAGDLPPGDYWLALGLYAPATFERLPVQGAPPATASPLPYRNAVLLPVKIER
jgi:4-amino-4-deoxy-L-arabinose transferase-like glycosyltransferase